MARGDLMRLLGGLLQVGGGLGERYFQEKRQRQLGEQRGQRLQDLFKSVPGLKGLESGIDPSTGELSDLAMAIFKERGSTARSKAETAALMDRLNLKDKLERERREDLAKKKEAANIAAEKRKEAAAIRAERRKRRTRFEEDPVEFGMFLEGRGLPPIEQFGEYGLSQEDILDRISKGEQLPQSTYVPAAEKAWWENLVPFSEGEGEEAFYDITDPLGRIDQSPAY